MGQSLKLQDARERTPAVNEVGAWADALRAAAFNAVNESDMTAVMKSLVERAKKGDNGAAKIVLAYLTGGGAPAPKGPMSLPREVTDLLEALTARLENAKDSDVPRLGESRGQMAGVRANGAGKYEVLAPVGEYATEQEAEAEARKVSKQRNGQSRTV